MKENYSKYNMILFLFYSAKGLYFITTNSHEPYGRGEEGVKPANS